MKINNLMAGVFFIVGIISFYLYWSISSKFPVTRYICDSSYNNCFADSKYDTRENCEYSGEMSSWRCDSRDKSNIKCYVPSESNAKGYCK